MWDPDAKIRTMRGPSRRTSVAGELGRTWLTLAMVATMETFDDSLMDRSWEGEAILNDGYLSLKKSVNDIKYTLYVQLAHGMEIM